LSLTSITRKSKITIETYIKALLRERKIKQDRVAKSIQIRDNNLSTNLTPIESETSRKKSILSSIELAQIQKLEYSKRK